MYSRMGFIAVALSRPPNHPISSGFFFLLGFALMKLAFYVADEPSPPIETQLLYLALGILSVISIIQGTLSFMGFIVTLNGFVAP